MYATDTDPEVRRELVETVRRFIAREVAPVASEMEHSLKSPPMLRIYLCTLLGVPISLEVQISRLI